MLNITSLPLNAITHRQNERAATESARDKREDENENAKQPN